MHTLQRHRTLSRISILSILLSILLTAASALAANVSLRWDANDPAPEGYRVFARQSGANYDYANPIWESNLTECTLIGLTEGVTYYFVVRAYDGSLESADSEEVSYTPPVAATNQAPVADAGQNQSVYEGAAVFLDASGSSDADGSIAACQWRQTGGTSVTLANAATARSSFTAPVVDLGGDTLTFSLTVTDDEGSSASASVTVSVLKSSSTDVDGDHVPDVLDLFPEDPSEWADNDGDGTGDNADTDDDNDGMSDSWENTYGLDPMTDDADQDVDGDGVSNIDEFTAGSDPTAAPGNTAPDAPVIEAMTQVDAVSLTPGLVTEAYFDDDNDNHAQSRWQISTENDFGILILDEASTTQLTAYTVGEMVLEADTEYFWRVRFIDSRSGSSDWSETASFTTLAVEDSDDTDANGIPDDQEVTDATADVNENGIADSEEDGIMCLNTVEGQTMIGVEPLSDDVTVVSIKSIASDTIDDQSVNLDFGLIGFKLYLQSGVTTASVKISFDTKVPDDASLYKYTIDSGWQEYDNAVFAADGKSVTLMLEDGGAGDEDGVINGVIVDPSGVVTTDTNSAILATGDSSSGGGGGGGGCFIGALQRHADRSSEKDTRFWKRFAQSVGHFWTAMIR